MRQCWYFQYRRTNNQLIWSVRNKRIVVAGQCPMQPTQQSTFFVRLSNCRTPTESSTARPITVLLFQHFEVTECSVSHLDNIGLGLLQLFFIVVGPFLKRWGGFSVAFNFHPRDNLAASNTFRCWFQVSRTIRSIDVEDLSLRSFFNNRFGWLSVAKP